MPFPDADPWTEAGVDTNVMPVPGVLDRLVELHARTGLEDRQLGIGIERLTDRRAQASGWVDPVHLDAAAAGD